MLALDHVLNHNDSDDRVQDAHNSDDDSDDDQDSGKNSNDAEPDLNDSLLSITLSLSSSSSPSSSSSESSPEFSSEEEEDAKEEQAVDLDALKARRPSVVRVVVNKRRQRKKRRRGSIVKASSGTDSGASGNDADEQRQQEQEQEQEDEAAPKKKVVRKQKSAAARRRCAAKRRRKGTATLGRKDTLHRGGSGTRDVDALTLSSGGGGDSDESPGRTKRDTAGAVDEGESKKRRRKPRPRSMMEPSADKRDVISSALKIDTEELAKGAPAKGHQRKMSDPMAVVAALNTGNSKQDRAAMRVTLGSQTSRVRGSAHRPERKLLSESPPPSSSSSSKSTKLAKMSKMLKSRTTTNNAVLSPRSRVMVAVREESSSSLVPADGGNVSPHSASSSLRSATDSSLASEALPPGSASLTSVTAAPPSPIQASKRRNMPRSASMSSSSPASPAAMAAAAAVAAAASPSSSSSSPSSSSSSAPSYWWQSDRSLHSASEGVRTMAMRVVLDMMRTMQLQHADIESMASLLELKAIRQEESFCVANPQVFADSGTLKALGQAASLIGDYVAKQRALRSVVMLQSHARRRRVQTLPRDELASMLWRNRVLTDVVDDERHFVRCTRDVLEGYLAPMRGSGRFHAADVKAVFGGDDLFERLLALHRQLRDELLEALGGEPFVTGFGRILMAMAPKFGLHVEYAESYAHAVNTLRTLTERSKHQAFIDDAASRASTGLPLAELLEMPTRRVSRYVAALEHVANHTHVVPDDHKQVLGALSILRQVERCVRQALGHSDEIAQWLNVRRRLRFDADDLADGHLELLNRKRKFVCEGSVAKVASPAKSHKNTRLLVFDDIVLLCKGSSSSKAVTVLRSHHYSASSSSSGGGDSGSGGVGPGGGIVGGGSATSGDLKLIELVDLDSTTLLANCVADDVVSPRSAAAAAAAASSASEAASDAMPAPSTTLTLRARKIEALRFQMVVVSGGGQSDARPYTFVCASTEERNRWVETLRSLIDARKGSRVFGMPLRTVLERERAAVPNIVRVTCKHLLKHGIAHGIFRISASRNVVETLIKNFDTGQASAVDLSVVSPHAVAGVLKRYLVELPDPLVSFALYTKLIAAHRRAPSIEALPDALASALRPLHRSMPPESAALLRHLMHFLRQLCKHSATTKMTEKNCAIVFAPTLMYPAEQTIEAALDATRVNDIVEALITHAHLLKEKKQGSQVNK
jgi:uncharacterized membrane protein YgcG